MPSPAAADEPTIGSSSTRSVFDDGNPTSHKVHLLERQLRQKDATLSKLRQAMEATEKVQSERFSFLEGQVQGMEASEKAQSELIVFLERQVQGMEASEKAQTERLSLLEMQVERLVDTSVRNSQLLQTMEASEKAHKERTGLSERQLERLLDLSSSDRATLWGSKDPSLPLNLANGDARPDVVEDNGERQEATDEIAALQEMLAKVVAEKDRLILRNDDLESMLESGNSRGDHGDGEAPSNLDELDYMIEELDSAISRERKTKRWDDGEDRRRDQHLDANDEWFQEDYHSEDIHHIQQDPPESYAEPVTVLYKVSCRDCPTDEPDVNYVGCLSTTSDSTAQDLITVVSHHYSQVWDMVQHGGSVPLDMEDGDSFPSSSLATWLVTEHGGQFSEEEEVLQWCMDNLKVEIKEDDGKEGSLRGKREKKKRRNKKHKKMKTNRMIC